MRKMRTPEIDVIRFTESDIVAASGGKFITIADLGDSHNVTAKFTIGANTLDSNTIFNEGYDKCKDMMNACAGGETDGWIFVGNNQTQLFGLARDDCWGYDDSEYYSVYNGTYEWNGNIFLKKQ